MEEAVEMQGAGEIQGAGNLHNNSKFSLFYVCFVCLCRYIMLNILHNNSNSICFVCLIKSLR